MDNALETEAPQQAYDILSNPIQREIIKRRTLDLVNAAENKDMVIFLDKSARPLSHLFRHVYPTVFPDKRLPKIRYVNMGTEKGMNLRLDQIPEITSVENLKTIFGNENIEELQKTLESGEIPEKRLVIDDVEVSGDTRKRAEHIFKIINNSEYNFFFFLDSPEDKKLFPYDPDPFDDTVPIVHALPWYGNASIIRDRKFQDRRKMLENKSFRVAINEDPEARKYELNLRRELDMLAEEIKAV
jgi:hypothetical protein